MLVFEQQVSKISSICSLLLNKCASRNNKTLN